MWWVVGGEWWVVGGEGDSRPGGGSAGLYRGGKQESCIKLSFRWTLLFVKVFFMHTVLNNNNNKLILHMQKLQRGTVVAVHATKSGDH